MATYYISPSGSDANNGLGPDASHATNKPWLTIGKALGASGIASGDTVYVAPGTYREVVTVAMTSATVETQILADPENAQGFKNGSGVRLTGGDVTWTAFTTNDTSAPAASPLLNLSGRDFLTFSGFIMIGGSSQKTLVDGQTTLSTDITFRDCMFISGSSNSSAIMIWATTTANNALNWMIDRCTFAPGTAVSGIGIFVQLPTSGSADYDVNFTVRNCLAIGTAPSTSGTNSFIRVDPSGASAFKGGGVDVLNCTCMGSLLLSTNGANLSTSVPCTAYNNLVVGPIGLSSTTVGQITEDYNLLYSASPRSNVTAGGNSVVAPNRAPLLHYGHSRVTGDLLRPFGMPIPGSPVLGFGNQAGAPTVDLLNRPRPAGGASTANAVGCMERHDTAVKETTTTDAGSVGLAITGPGDHDFLVPVNASSTTISVKARYDTNHATTNKPQAILLANNEIGVSTETLTMTAAADTWETLTFTPFTPTAKGYVTIRLVSRSAAGNGNAFFDTASVPDIDTGDFGHYRRGEPFPAIASTGTTTTGSHFIGG